MPIRRLYRAVLPALTLAALAALAVPAARAGAAPAAGRWNRADQRAVARAGLLAPLGGAFHGERPLTGAELRPALAALAQAMGTVGVGVGDGPLSVASLDAALVRQLGLADVASAVWARARGAGLAPPAGFGTEVVARQLELRTNHPAGQDALEQYPWDAVTRAEAAHSLSVLLRGGGGAVAQARDVLLRFAPPRAAPAQRRVLRAAAQRIGMPYVWGGELDRASADLGGQVHGGYDCSGLVWRAFKLSGSPLGAAIGGKATERSVTHTGIALGGGFMIESSAQGVAVAPLWEPGRARSFAWARHLS